MMEYENLVWPDTFPELKVLNDLLKCGICYELMTTSVTTYCSHTYCSLCIRQYLNYKAECPKCFLQTTDQQLRTNRVLDEIIGLLAPLNKKVNVFVKRTKLTLSPGKDNVAIKSSSISCNRPNFESINVSKNQKEFSYHCLDLNKSDNVKPITSALSPMVEKCPVTPKKSALNLESGLEMSPASSTKQTTLLNFVTTPQKQKASIGDTLPEGSQGYNTPKGLSFASTSASSPWSFMTKKVEVNSSASSSKSAVFLTEDLTKVSCPVCSVRVPKQTINQHLDDCLKRSEERTTRPVVDITKRRPLPKLVYALLSEKQLRSKLKEVGLPSLGDKQDLIKRHKKYTLLYNAECDKVAPRSKQEILRQIESEEKDKTKAVPHTSVFNYDRKTAPEIIEKEQTAYIKKNESHFAKLVADIKKRKLEKIENNDQTNANNTQVISNGFKEHCSSPDLDDNASPTVDNDENYVVSNSHVQITSSVNASTCSTTTHVNNINDDSHATVQRSKNNHINSSTNDNYSKARPPDNNNMSSFCNDDFDDRYISPDFFNSPAHSEGSNESISLLEEQVMDDDFVEQSFFHIPPSSPLIKRRVTRSCTRVKQDTQMTCNDTLSDPDYIPSQDLDSMTSQECSEVMPKKQNKRNSEESNVKAKKRSKR